MLFCFIILVSSFLSVLSSIVEKCELESREEGSCEARIFWLQMFTNCERKKYDIQ